MTYGHFCSHCSDSKGINGIKLSIKHNDNLFVDIAELVTHIICYVSYFSHKLTIYLPLSYPHLIYTLNTFILMRYCDIGACKICICFMLLCIANDFDITWSNV